MKQTLLLVAVMAFVSIALAQKKITAYAITGAQKGQSGWNEVRLIDITTGEEMQSVYKNGKDVEILNARTGKPVRKTDVDNLQNAQVFKVRELNDARELNKAQELRVVQEKNKLQQENVTQKKNLENALLATTNPNINTNITTNINTNVSTNINRTVIVRAIDKSIRSDKPFATSSAAMAYDKKHERLYYTPMNIAQLRYIDLKTGKIYYFEDEAFGLVQGRGDVQNQITRMVIASDGNGYAITNDANHLIQFTTGKKTTITDLGPLSDNASNGSYSVHNSGRFGGDVIADANKNLYLIGADRTVYKVSLESKVANYLGSIKGLPKGFTTNGAIAEDGSTVIVTSSTSTIGYFRFDLNTLLAEKVSTSADVYNASDLANDVLAFEKTKKKKEKERKFTPVNDIVVTEDPVKEEAPDKTENTQRTPTETISGNISVYPNPVRNGLVKLSFADLLPGKYQIQLMDVSGRIISSKRVSINSKLQVEEFRLPNQMASGNYVVKVVGAGNKVSSFNKLVVE